MGAVLEASFASRWSLPLWREALGREHGRESGMGGGDGEMRSRGGVLSRGRKTSRFRAISGLKGKRCNNATASREDNAPEHHHKKTHHFLILKAPGI